MGLAIYDTLRREQVPFEPREEGKASIYVCGPTVQAEPHVGHGRASVVFDVLRRWLTASGHDVTFVRNITDVDDKIIIRATREQGTPAMIAERYSRAYADAMRGLDVLPPDVEPRATGHILEMQDLISTLVDQDKAYEVDGNVLFRVRSFPEYGKLSNRRIDDMQQGEDLVAVDKQDPLDFALWKAAKPGEPSWPSPWGPGRPGWHIECSAMATKRLGGEFDIHGGGLDLVFPHHENEIAQHEAAHGTTFARYWMHNGMVQMDDEKMSKSIGNVVGLLEAVERWGVGPLRLWYLSAHHRSPLLFSEDRLDEAVNAFDRLTTFVRTAELVVGEKVDADLGAAAAFVEEFSNAMDDDLNAPQAVAALHNLVSDGHERLKQAEGGDEAARAAVRGLADELVRLADEVLGLGIEAALAASKATGRRLAPLIERLLDQRSRARADRDFETADAIRDQLAAAGVVVEDRAGGSRWFIDPTA